MIKSFKDAVTRDLFDGKSPRRFRAIRKAVFRKLDMIAAAHELSDLKAPPGNRLEGLKGDRKGQHSIRINKQYRVCFVWNDGAEDVEITDYH